MANLNIPLMQQILRECDAADPEAWLPKQSSHSWEELKPSLERLWADGHVDRIHTDHPDDLAFALTDSGDRLLRSPDA